MSGNKEEEMIHKTFPFLDLLKHLALVVIPEGRVAHQEYVENDYDPHSLVQETILNVYNIEHCTTSAPQECSKAQCLL